MPTQRPIGGPPMRGNTPKDVERITNQINFLISLVPREPTEKLMKEVLDEIDVEITEHEARENPGEAPTELSENEKQRQLKAETDHLIGLLVRGWVDCLFELVARCEKTEQIFRLDENLLPTDPIDLKEMGEMGLVGIDLDKHSTWLKYALLSTIPNVTANKDNKVIKIYNSFTANLKSEIDKQEKKTLPFFEDCRTMLTIGHDESGYFLRVTNKP